MATNDFLDAASELPSDVVKIINILKKSPEAIEMLLERLLQAGGGGDRYLVAAVKACPPVFLHLPRKTRNVFEIATAVTSQPFFDNRKYLESIDDSNPRLPEICDHAFQAGFCVDLIIEKLLGSGHRAQAKSMLVKFGTEYQKQYGYIRDFLRCNRKENTPFTPVEAYEVLRDASLEVPSVLYEAETKDQGCLTVDQFNKLAFDAVDKFVRKDDPSEIYKLSILFKYNEVYQRAVAINPHCALFRIDEGKQAMINYLATNKEVPNFSLFFPFRHHLEQDYDFACDIVTTIAALPPKKRLQIFEAIESSIQKESVRGYLFSVLDKVFKENPHFGHIWAKFKMKPEHGARDSENGMYIPRDEKAIFRGKFLKLIKAAQAGKFSKKPDHYDGAGPNAPSP